MKGLALLYGRAHKEIGALERHTAQNAFAEIPPAFRDCIGAAR